MQVPCQVKRFLGKIVEIPNFFFIAAKLLPQVTWVLHHTKNLPFFLKDVKQVKGKFFNIFGFFGLSCL